MNGNNHYTERDEMYSILLGEPPVAEEKSFTLSLGLGI
jgi:hypothetical protein